MYCVQIHGWDRAMYITDLNKITNILTATNLKLVEIDGFYKEVININKDQTDPANIRQVDCKPIVNQWLIYSVKELV